MNKLFLILIIIMNTYGNDELYRANTIQFYISEGIYSKPKRDGFEIENDKWRENQNGNPDLIVDNIDIENGIARLIGNGGEANVFVIANGAGLNFIEETPMGNLTFLTVYNKRNKYNQEEYYFVYSRHISILEPIPSQWYGKAKIVNYPDLKKSGLLGQ